jgi:hypothetical protein
MAVMTDGFNVVAVESVPLMNERRSLDELLVAMERLRP